MTIFQNLGIGLQKEGNYTVANDNYELQMPITKKAKAAETVARQYGRAAGHAK